MRRLLVTVGTFQFPDLINIVYTNIDEILEKFDHVFMQIGEQDLTGMISNENLYICKFMKEIKYEKFDYVVCHCGIGSIMGGLLKNKTVIGVVNSSLKDNHQEETAAVFSDYIHILKTDKLIDFLVKDKMTPKKKLKILKSDQTLKNILSIE